MAGYFPKPPTKLKKGEKVIETPAIYYLCCWCNELLKEEDAIFLIYSTAEMNEVTRIFCSEPCLHKFAELLKVCATKANVGGEVLN